MATLLRILILAIAVWLPVQILICGIRVKANQFGNPPISRPAFLLAKVSAAISFILLILRAGFDPPHLSTIAEVVCIFLLLGGTIVFTLGLSRIGGSLRVGLPMEETTLVTSGLYRLTRNPIYVGMYWMMAASLLYAFSWLNLLSAVAAVVLHHRIILAEERFLATQFKDFQAYCSRVRRYL
ncbi:MAG TPA: isoprenylcysteine carboxylmethyltransferase family protein [Acidobacteriota bacterium]|nr:isoprenylcysteine carboxylmethyltransferase family protein [Acidobacteriota bacterium]